MMLLEGWERSTVGAACTIKNNLRFPLNVDQRAAAKGPYPYFGPTGVLGYLDHYRIDEEFAVIGEDGDHFLKYRDRSMTLHFSGKANVNNHAHVIGASERCSPKWFYYWFMHRDLAPALSRQGVGRYKLTKKSLSELEIWLPPIEEQRAVTQLLDTWDAAIATSEQLLANSRMRKQALMHALLMGRARRQGFAVSSRYATTKMGRVPEDWKHVAIGELAKEVSQKNGEDLALPVLSCTKHEGLVDSLTYFKKRVFSEDTSTYKLVPRGCFAYATNHIDEGSIGYQNLYDRALISPMYTVFSVGEQVEHGFLFKLLKTDHYRQVFAANTNASVDRRGGLRWSDFKKIEIPLPSTPEQRAISEVIDAAEEDVRSCAAEVEALRKEKRSLMADLLNGKRRVRLPAAETTP
jgi:type I restriction enzyme S subunit